MLKKSDSVEEFTWYDKDGQNGQRVTARRNSKGEVTEIAVGSTMAHCMPVWQIKNIVAVLRELGVEV